MEATDEWLHNSMHIIEGPTFYKLTTNSFKLMFSAVFGFDWHVATGVVSDFSCSRYCID